MIKSATCIRIATSMTLFAGIAMLAGCGPEPYTHATTTEQTTTITPAPVVSTETPTTNRAYQSR